MCIRDRYKAKDYRANPANAEQISHWIADQCTLDYETVYAQRVDAEWLTSAEMVTEIEDGTMEKPVSYTHLDVYKRQKFHPVYGVGRGERKGKLRRARGDLGAHGCAV